MNTDMNEVRKWIDGADALLITASNGLSIAEGYHLFADNEMFRSQFADFRERFGVRSVLEGASFPYASQADRAEFYRRLRHYWVDLYEPSGVMLNLKRLVADKDYFILTSNGDLHLEKSGFDEDRIFEIEGTFKDEFMPSEQVLRKKNEAFQAFFETYKDKQLVVLELGIGSRNRLIKQPMMQLVAQNRKMKYITLNMENELFVPNEIQPRSIALAGDLAVTLQKLVEE